MIRTAICSFGYSTRTFHAPFIAALPEHFELKAFVERHDEQSKELYPAARIYRSCEELFADEEIDLVVVNTPSPTHFEYALKALNAGKHTVIDKPFAATSREAELLIDAAKKNNRLLSVFHNRRWEGELVALKKVLDENLLGKLIDGEFRFERFKTQPNPKSHKEEPLPGNGLMYELCTHLIDQSLFLFGKPQSVSAEIRREREFSQIDDYCLIRLHYAAGFGITLKSSLLVADIGPSYIVNGHAGSFVKYRANVQEQQASKGLAPGDSEFGAEDEATAARLTTLQADGSLKTVRLRAPASSYSGYYRQLAEAFAGRAEVPVAPDDALTGIRIIEAAYRSAKERRTVDLD